MCCARCYDERMEDEKWDNCDAPSNQSPGNWSPYSKFPEESDFEEDEDFDEDEASP